MNFIIFCPNIFQFRKLMFKFLEVLVDCKVGRKVIVYSISSNSSKNLMYNILQCHNIINFIYCFNANFWILFLSTKFSCASFIGIDDCLSHIETHFLRKFPNAMNLIQNHTIFTLRICRSIGATWISCCVNWNKNIVSTML